VPPRLKAILGLHAAWRVARRSGGVVYICGDEDGVARLRKLAPSVGLHADGGGGLRVELLEAIKAESLAAFETRRPNASVAQQQGVAATA
jgi:hypothetical protein